VAGEPNVKLTGDIVASSLRRVFDDRTCRKLRQKAANSPDAAYIVSVLDVQGDTPSSNEPHIREKNRKVLASWDAYLSASEAIGMFDGQEGRDLKARLRSGKDPNFRAAMAECCAAWYLAGPNRQQLKPRPLGRTGKVLEFEFTSGGDSVYVEVKAPYSPIVDTVWVGDDSGKLENVLAAANRQFDTGVRNLLVLVPRVRIPVYQSRGQLAKALFAEPILSVPINSGIDNGGPDPVHNTTIQSGSFLMTRRANGQPFKKSGGPRFTRLSAVLTIEEFLGGESIEHRVLAAINPYAEAPISEEELAGVPILAVRDGILSWSDGESLWS